MKNSTVEPAIYRDLLDPHCNALNISAAEATTYYDENVPVVSLVITSDVSCDEDDAVVYIRLEDVERVIGMIRAAATEAGE